LPKFLRSISPPNFPYNVVMESLDLKISGVYDIKTFEFLVGNNINHFGFDFRPRSLTFLQQHKFLEMLASAYSTKHVYYLNYANEPKFITDKMVLDLSERYGSAVFGNQFILTFSDNQPKEFYSSFGSGYYRYYSDDMKLTELLADEKLSGLIFDHSTVEKLHADGSIYQFLKVLNTLAAERGRALKILLRIRWGSEIIQSVLDSFSFDLLQIDVDSKIEASYRNVDLGRLGDELKYVRKNMMSYNGNRTSAQGNSGYNQFRM